MNKYNGLLVFALLLGTLAIKGQDSLIPVKQEQAIAQIGIDKKTYIDFSNGIRQFNRRLVNLLRDTSLNRDQQRAAIEKFHAERKAFVRKYLNADQQKIWETIEKQHGRPLPAGHQRVAAIRKKRMDNTKLKTNSN
jgi:hypothetical protein